jgi:Rod binding domain-containing protein
MTVENLHPLVGALERGKWETTPSTDEPSRLRQAVKDLEALFLYEMFKEMRKTAGSNGLWGKDLSGEIYGSLFDMKLAETLAERGTGLGDMILKQMEVRWGSTSRPPDRGHLVLPVKKEEGSAGPEREIREEVWEK